MVRYIIFVCLLFVAGAKVLATDFYPKNKAVTYIQKILKTSDIVINGSFKFGKAVGASKNVVVYSFTCASLLGNYYAIFTESMGRYEFFDYLVITDNTGTVQKVSVLKYRSEHGGEIASKKWLSQFENFSGDTLIYGEDISVISGATISATSITRDIPEIVKIIKKQIIQDIR